MGSKATNMTGVVENGFEFILLVKIDENMDQCPTKVWIITYIYVSYFWSYDELER